MVRDSLVRWPLGLHLSIPISPVLDSVRDEAVARGLAGAPLASGTVVEALMWLRLGRFDPAHAIVQGASKGMEAYVHGMLHRLEGDHWNANYWFRQVRNRNLGDRIQEFLGARKASFPWQGGFDPEKFTRAHEIWQGTRESNRERTQEVLQGIALLEWEAVWENALNSLF